MSKVVLLGLLMSLTGQHPEEVARYNAYLTLHMEGVYGARVDCAPFHDDPDDPYVYRCKAETPDAVARLYCASTEVGPWLCKNHFVVVK